jgi:hypothetical protein
VAPFHPVSGRDAAPLVPASGVAAFHPAPAWDVVPLLPGVALFHPAPAWDVVPLVPGEALFHPVLVWGVVLLVPGVAAFHPAPVWGVVPFRPASDCGIAPSLLFPAANCGPPDVIAGGAGCGALPAGPWPGVAALCGPAAGPAGD